MQLSETLFIGKQIVTLDVVDSTNNYAANLLSTTKVLDGTVIMAYFQDRGKGQRGNSWYSEPGKNLTFSLVLKPSFVKVEEQFILSKAVSLALCEYCEKATGKNAFIKWPNDIIVDQKKICGILIENQFRGKKLEHSIIGIGFNINQVDFGEVTTATSLKLLTTEEKDISKELSDLLIFVEKYYLMLRNGRVKEVEEQYLESLLYHGDQKNYLVEGENFTTMILDVLPNGRLVTRTPQGKIKTFDFKEIEFIL